MLFRSGLFLCLGTLVFSVGYLILYPGLGKIGRASCRERGRPCV
ncbi:hypothetical protein PPUN14671_51950 [Pseudomonas putida]|uniref:Cbb3-type cytochrome c oxidase subunit CcoP N-terminal domain-containing protein n=1 Tax=Pseudomonas putida TaxID=303 RepID=A0AA37VP77_PSEPU|nr:hypothetical protein PPUN14671_51950 [Pseudomonas putida]